LGCPLIINGVFVSEKLSQVVRQAAELPDTREKETNPRGLRSADTTQFVPSDFTVTEGTTKHLDSHRH